MGDRILTQSEIDELIRAMISGQADVQKTKESDNEK